MIIRSPSSSAARAMLVVAAGTAALAVLAGLVLGGAPGAASWLERLGLAAGPVRAATAPPPRSDGAIVLSPNERRSLVIEPVGMRMFRPQFVTEGKIATDEDRATPVLSPYAGKVVRILVKPGDVVVPGQVLCTIEATDMVAAQNDYVAAVSGLDKARTAVRLAEINERRQRDLYNGRAATLRDFEQAQADLKGAQADERAAVAALRAVENRLRILGKGEADLAQLRDRGTINSETPIVAPIGGLIAQRKVGPGQFVQGSGGDALFLVDDTTTVWLQAFVREGDSPAVDVGDEMEFRVLARPDQTFRATISHVSPLLDPATRRMVVRASVPNPRGLLKREMFASVVIFTERPTESPAVPRRAVIRQGERAHVWRLDDAGRAALREVRTGLVQDGFVQITEGLAAGDQVVVQGSLFLDQMAADTR
ncbi:efflux RND transporter periplasmic adaptor subunit [Phreatobacter sp. AB_2022a]|uniref:efflux RND transporter periplasmic adaptor subunit n=1 Tax=Phreatobacter sp. AB_2022a TaxID=3003134 RepID=UPI0022873BE6|nr:efflux RND transporter periplasmic adaptor subunit [Phreatobacter sp. AB_2022a]MCZ0732773.1 efflux RND transporter periplasmic adaptor subunit [Phreatobacter sp. AB_2022a]